MGAMTQAFVGGVGDNNVRRHDDCAPRLRPSNNASAIPVVIGVTPISPDCTHGAKAEKSDSAKPVRARPAGAGSAALITPGQERLIPASESAERRQLQDSGPDDRERSHHRRPRHPHMVRFPRYQGQRQPPGHERTNSTIRPAFREAHNAPLRLQERGGTMDDLFWPARKNGKSIQDVADKASGPQIAELIYQ